MKKSCVFALALIGLTSCSGDRTCELRLEHLQEIRDKGLVVIDPGFLKGSEYLQLDERKQQHYLDGIVDGMRLVPYFGAYDQTYPESRLKSLLYCVATWGSDRKTIVDDYLRAHPEKQKDSSNVVIYAAFAEACNDIVENCRDSTCQGLSRI